MHIMHVVIDPLVSICRLLTLALPQSGLREDGDVLFGKLKKSSDIVGLFLCIEYSAQRN